MPTLVTAYACNVHSKLSSTLAANRCLSSGQQGLFCPLTSFCINVSAISQLIIMALATVCRDDGAQRARLNRDVGISSSILMQMDHRHRKVGVPNK